MTDEVLTPPPFKEWVKLTHTPTGTNVRVTLQSGRVSTSWTTKCYTLDQSIKDAISQSRSHAAHCMFLLLEQAPVHN